MEREIAAFLGTRPADHGALRLLDIGSPKLFGFYLARKYPVDLHLTDISPLNVDPYRNMWAAIRSGARGRVSFGICDARRLAEREGTYDIVYAMSVLEHIEGGTGDGEAVAEMIRVVKPGGLLLFSVPLGPAFREQAIRGVTGAVKRTGRDSLYFFQRIYDPAHFESRLHQPLCGLIDRERARTVDRRPSLLLRAYHQLRGSLPEALTTALGFLNPVMSAAFNRDRPGIVKPEVAAYGPVHRFSDIFADVIFAARKKSRP